MVYQEVTEPFLMTKSFILTRAYHFQNGRKWFLRGKKTYVFIHKAEVNICTQIDIQYVYDNKISWRCNQEKISKKPLQGGYNEKGLS